jgi:serralysin
MTERFVDIFDSYSDPVTMVADSYFAHQECCACADCLGGADKAPGGDVSYAVDTVPGSIATTVTLTVGGYLSGEIDNATDSDWYQVTLVAGQTYTFSTILGGGLSDSVLRLRDSAGALITANDDAIVNSSFRFSEITYTATASGTFFLDVTGYNGATGTFFLTSTAPVADAIAASSATTASLTLGAATTAGTLQANGDHDWYAVNLVAGQTYLFTTTATGGTDIDTTLMLRNASGTLLAYNDDSAGTFSRVRFIATTTGTFYLDVGAWANNESGNYNVRAEIAPPLTVYTNDQIANQLTNTYWGGTQRHWNVAPGGTITVNITGLTAPAQALAREALLLWTDSTGINFSEVATGGQLTFDDTQPGAYASSVVSGSIITSSTINVSETWLTSSGSTLRSYTFQAFIHEIGHSLGLGHGGNYNSSADYVQDASYLNDSWATTIMSYFDQTENTYFANLGFTRQFSVTPLIADLVATTNLYGAVTTTRTGNTVYGVGNNTGRASFDASLANAPLTITIVDHGGNDTLDYSVYSVAQRIDLNAETFSNVGGRTGNVSIARGTVIENAIGGSGVDTIVGNSANNEITGNGGNDILDGGAGTGDIAVYAGNSSEYQVVTNGGVTTVTGLGARAGDGADTLTNIESIRFANTSISLGSAANNPVQLGSPTMADQAVNDGAVYSYQIPATSFIDLDVGTVLTFVATMANGSALPAWLNFNAATRTFSGIPPLASVGSTLDIRVTASDQSTSAADNFLLTINLAPGADIVGSSTADILFGTFRSETMIGLDGEDIFYGSAGADRIDGGVGLADTVNYSLSPGGVTINLSSGAANGGDANGDFLVALEGAIGSAFADNIIGTAGNDMIEGGAGDDILNGGLGTDTVSYASSTFGVTVHLDNPTSQNTVQQGMDTIIGFENIIGSNSHDSLWGDAGNNVIEGRDGFDTIVSGGGINVLIGGAGGDTYFAQGSFDTVTEAIGGGYDVVLAQTNFALGAGSEVEALAVNTAAGITLGGNEFGQTLTGGSGDDTLNAGGGNDLLISGAGTNILAGGANDDIYYAQGINDVVTELAGGGFDVVLAGGNLTLASNSEVEVIAVNTATGVTIVGSNITQTIQGGAGNDRFIGGLGNDTLTGSGGADTFVLRNTFVDRDFITDFTSGSDKIEISAALFGGGLSAGGLTAAQFLSGAGAVAATTAAQRFIYNSSTGNLYFDADGNGAGASVIIANLSNVGTLTASDFIITAAAEEPSTPKDSSADVLDVMDVSKVFANDNVVSADVFDGGILFTDQIIFADSGLERWGQVAFDTFV